MHRAARGRKLTTSRALRNTPKRDVAQMVQPLTTVQIRPQFTGRRTVKPRPYQRHRLPLVWLTFHRCTFLPSCLTAGTLPFGVRSVGVTAANQAPEHTQRRSKETLYGYTCSSWEVKNTASSITMSVGGEVGLGRNQIDSTFYSALKIGRAKSC